MGSGATRKFWASKGSRTARRQNTKTRRPAGKAARLKMKAWRAEAKQVASGNPG